MQNRVALDRELDDVVAAGRDMTVVVSGNKWSPIAALEWHARHSQAAPPLLVRGLVPDLYGFVRSLSVVLLAGPADVLDSIPGAERVRDRDTAWHRARFVDLRLDLWRGSAEAFTHFAIIRYDWTRPAQHVPLPDFMDLTSNWLTNPMAHLAALKQRCQEQWQQTSAPWWLQRLSMTLRALGDQERAAELDREGATRFPWWDEFHPLPPV